MKNPLKRQPLKNPMCPKYDECLNKAVKAEKRFFKCSGCRLEHIQREAGDLALNDLVGSWRLLAALFKPTWLPSRVENDDFQF